ncbi:MAG: alcohol dehydrogenase catalytic domain-containing protein [Myxococcota bacterium]
MKALLFGERGTAARSDVLPGLAFLKQVDVPTPDLPGGDWVVVKSRIAGICGSDLGTLQGKPAPLLEPFFSSQPYVLGHELFGTIESTGARAGDLRPGQRVVVDPTLACSERGFAPACAQCAANRPALCERSGEGRLAPGLLIGGCPDTGGGWGEYFVASAGRVHRVPDEIDDDEASLVEPFSVCLRPALEHRPEPGDLVVVLGAGMIGLMSVAALKAVEPRCRVVAVAKYPFQAQCAELLGADHVIDATADDVVDQIGALAQSRVYKLSSGGSVLRAGVPLVHDSVANRSTLDLALRITRGAGKIVLLGLPSALNDLDWTVAVVKEIQIVGSLMYGSEAFEGGPRPTFARALELLRSRRVDLRAIRPRTYPIEEYTEALQDAATKTGRDAIKISFAF